jgi:hypothetical protein
MKISTERQNTSIIKQQKDIEGLERAKHHATLENI